MSAMTVYDNLLRDKNGNPLHPFCKVCGWRKGGIDSWDGNRCKCGHSGLPMRELTVTEFPSQRSKSL